MAYINLDPNYFEHLKSKRLRIRLGEYAEMIPLKLWCHAAKYCPEDGIFKGYTEEDLAILVGYNKDPKGMLDALIEFEMIEKTCDGWYKIHEWETYQGHIKAFSIRAKKANAMRWGKISKDKSSLMDPSGIQQGSSKESPIPTIPTILTKKNTTVFLPPTIAEINEYCQKHSYELDAEAYIAYNEARDWKFKDGRKMKSWKADITFLIKNKLKYSEKKDERKFLN